MSSTAARSVLVVAGLGTGAGTGAATARLFSKQGYSIALIARGADSVNSLAAEINAAGGNAASFPIASYAPGDLISAFKAIYEHFPAPTFAIRVALFNASAGVRKPFLEITEDEVKDAVDVNIVAAFAFAKQVLLAFKGNEIEGVGKRGTLIFTGATASLRGNVTTSAFAAGKFGLRALSQSLAKEFGKENIHVAHAIIDGGILTDRSRSFRNDPAWEQNPDVRLSPESIAQSYLYLTNQDRSAWTWELDLRPAHEKW